MSDAETPGARAYRLMAAYGWRIDWSLPRRVPDGGWPDDIINDEVARAVAAEREAGAIEARGTSGADALAEVRARAAVAEVNRMMRDSEVLFMQAPKDRPFAMVLIDIGAGDGAWRSPDHAVRGDCLISLGALMWGERYGRAARRIARLCGIYALPPAPPPLELGAVLQAAAERRIG